MTVSKLMELLDVSEDVIYEMMEEATYDSVSPAICPVHGEVGVVEPDGWMDCHECGRRADSILLHTGII